MKSLLYIFSLLFVLNGCDISGGHNQLPKTKDFKLLNISPKIDSKIFFSQLFDSVTYIPLETSNNFLIGQDVQKVLQINDSILVFDESTIFIFSLQGKYLNSFKLKGHGPGELTWPADFDIDLKNKTIEVLSFGDRKVVSFDLKTGKQTDEFFLDFNAENIYKRDDGTYIFFGEKHISGEKNFQHNLIFYKNGSIVKSSLSTQNFIIKYRGDSNNSFSKTEDGILYTQRLNNNFYQINSNNELEIKYEINYTTGNLPVNEDFFKKIDYLSDLTKTEYAFHFSGHFANDFYLYFRFFYKKATFDTFYDIKHNKILVGNKKVNDFDQGPSGYIVGLNKNYFLGMIEPTLFIKHFNKLRSAMGERKWFEYIQNHPRINHLLNTINQNDNQILMIYHLKTEFYEK